VGNPVSEVKHGWGGRKARAGKFTAMESARASDITGRYAITTKETSGRKKNRERVFFSVTSVRGLGRGHSRGSQVGEVSSRRQQRLRRNAEWGGNERHEEDNRCGLRICRLFWKKRKRKAMDQRRHVGSESPERRDRGPEA